MRSHAAIALMTLAGVLSAATPIRAQGNPDTARFRLGSLAVSPAIALTNAGWDSNVFNDSKDNHPKSTPAVEGWFRTPRMRLTGRSQLDMFYYRELTSLRAVDSNHSGRLDVTVNRLTPWVAGNAAVTRHSQNFEIDAIVKQRNDGLRVGTDVRLTRKTSVGISHDRSHLQYEGDALFRGTDLARSLNHTGSGEGVAVRYEVTPLTTFSFNLSRGRDRFALSPERNSDSVGIGPSVEFKPLALISGSAALGLRRVRFREAGQPEFKGKVATVDLHYNFRSRTQFGVGVLRSLEYSYLATQRDYVLTSVSTSMTQRVTDRWDIRGTVGRNRLSYRRPEAFQQILYGESIMSYDVNVGYYIGRSRLGFDVRHDARQSDVEDGRGYERLRISSVFTYAF